MKKLVLIFSGILFLGISCTPKTVPVAKTEVETTDKLAQGKTIFDNSCGRCHDLPNPTKYSSQDWVGIMNAMAPKAKLSDEQHQLVYNYVVSVKE